MQITFEIKTNVHKISL